MSRIRVQGVIIVRFPPPVPKDFGRALKGAVLERLAGRDECSTSNAVKLSTLDLTVKVYDARNVSACAHRLTECLPGAKLSACTQSRPGVVEGG